MICIAIFLGCGEVVFAATGSPMQEGNQEGGALLQFTTPSGQVLGFQPGAVIVAGLDHMLRVDFVEARAVMPVSENGGVYGSGGSDIQANRLQRVVYSEVWEGVTVIYESSEQSILKSSYEIRAGVPGRPVEQIRLRYNRPVRMDDRGNLVITYETGEMTEAAPVAWQVVGGQRRPVQATYLLLGEREVGFPWAPMTRVFQW